MSEIERVLNKYLGNSSELLGVLQDLVYSMVLGILIGEMKEVLEEEKEGIKTLRSDDTALEIGLKEIKKLEGMIQELEAVRIPASMNIKAMIRQRYMK